MSLRFKFKLLWLSLALCATVPGVHAAGTVADRVNAANAAARALGDHLRAGNVDGIDDVLEQAPADIDGLLAELRETQGLGAADRILIEEGIQRPIQDGAESFLAVVRHRLGSDSSVREAFVDSMAAAQRAKERAESLSADHGDALSALETLKRLARMGAWLKPDQGALAQGLVTEQTRRYDEIRDSETLADAAPSPAAPEKRNYDLEAIKTVLGLRRVPDAAALAKLEAQPSLSPGAIKVVMNQREDRPSIEHSIYYLVANAGGALREAIGQAHEPYASKVYVHRHLIGFLDDAPLWKAQLDYRRAMLVYSAKAISGLVLAMGAVYFLGGAWAIVPGAVLLFVLVRSWPMLKDFLRDRRLARNAAIDEYR